MSIFDRKSFVNDDRKVLLSFFIAAAVLYVPLLLWNEWPSRDTAFRYAPMAEAFARGDFRYAFHPRCQMLQPLVAGCLCAITGMSGLAACKFASLLFFMLGAVPLFYLAKAVFDRKTTLLTVALYLVCFHLVNVLVLEGGRDAAKMFVQIWMACEYIRISLRRDELSHYIRLGCACGLSICIRGDMLLIAGVVLFGCGIMDGRKHRLPWRSLLALLCAVAVASAEILINWAISGYAVPSCRFVELFQKIFHTDPTPAAFYLGAVLPAIPLFFIACKACCFMLENRMRRLILCLFLAVAFAAALFRIVGSTPCDADHLAKFISGICIGVSPAFFIPAAIGVICRIWQKRWSPAQSRIAGLFLLYILLLIGQIIIHDRCYYVSSRYLFPAVPLVLPWCAVGLITAVELICKYVPVLTPRLLACLAAAIIVPLCLYLAYRNEINNHFRKRELRDWKTIQELKKQFPSKERHFVNAPVEMQVYRDNVRPKVFFDNKIHPGYYIVSISLAGMGWSDKPGDADFIVTSAKCRDAEVSGKFKLKGGVRKYGREVRCRVGALQIWKVNQVQYAGQ